MADTTDHLLNNLYLSQKEIDSQFPLRDLTFCLISLSTSYSSRSDLSDIVLTEMSLTRDEMRDCRSESSNLASSATESFCLSFPSRPADFRSSPGRAELTRPVKFLFLTSNLAYLSLKRSLSSLLLWLSEPSETYIPSISLILFS